MKNTLLIIAISVVLSIGGTVLYFGDGDSPLGGRYSERTFNTASSTTFSIGNDVSLTVLPQSGQRKYASLCNAPESGPIYLIFDTTDVVATTTSSVSISGGSCYEITIDKLYTGVVQAIKEVSTTTSNLIITELRHPF